MRRRRVDQGSQITGFIAGAQGRHQDQTHSTRCRGPRDRLQNRRHFHGPKSLFREKELGPHYNAERAVLASAASVKTVIRSPNQDLNPPMKAFIPLG